MFGSLVCIIEGILAPFFGFWSSIAARLDCKKQLETVYYFYNFLLCDLLWQLWQINLSFLRRMAIIFSRFFLTAFKFCCISMRHDTKFLKICFPPSLGSIILSTAAKEFLFKGFFLGPAPLCLPPLKTPLALSKNYRKTCRFSTFSLFGSSRFEYASKLLIYLNVLPARAGSTFLQISASPCSTKT